MKHNGRPSSNEGGLLLFSALYCTSSALSPEETPEFSRNFTESTIVGYQTFTPDTVAGRQFVMVATQFAPLNESGKWTFTGNAFGQDLVEGDGFYFFDKALEDRVYYYFVGFENEQPVWVKQWLDGVTGDSLEDIVSSLEVVKGETLYWLPSDGETSISVSGMTEDVSESVIITFPDSSPYNLVNPFPVDTTLNDLATFFAEGDNLYIFDEELEDRVYYYYLGSADGWLKQWLDGVTGDSLEDIIDDGTTIILKAGQGGVFNASDDDGRTWTVSL